MQTNTRPAPVRKEQAHPMENYLDERILVAHACRVLALRGLVDDILGHVSLQIDDETVLVRCRGPQERGLRFTSPADILPVALNGQLDLPNGYKAPNELPLHLEVLRRHSQIRSVVHAHPPSVVAFSLTGRQLQPIIGAFNIPAMRMAREGIPIHPSSALIRTDQRAAAMAETLGDHPVCLLRGHGLASTGQTVAEAVIRALNVEVLARMHLAVLQAGGEFMSIDESDLDDLPDLGGSFNEDNVWRFLLRELEEHGLLIAQETNHG